MADTGGTSFWADLGIEINFGELRQTKFAGPLSGILVVGVALFELQDGYHRLAAARRCGLGTVEAEVRSGSRHDALQYAARVVAAERGISLGEVTSYMVERYAHDRRTSGW